MSVDCFLQAKIARNFQNSTWNILSEKIRVSWLSSSSRSCQEFPEKHLHFFSSLLAYGHCCHTPAVSVIGWQCHIHPSASRSVPVFTASKPYLLLVVSSFMPSSAKVPVTLCVGELMNSSVTIISFPVASFLSFSAATLLLLGLCGALCIDGLCILCTLFVCLP